ncbi:MAG TPA: DNA gyrase C-terminal beta-propeller domain-containing protein, partial [Chloroflexota bacterium]|nr:DNA gyrase C-terminal beta-propeller domain-containing protein [Chloroflexota bacterium]
HQDRGSLVVLTNNGYGKRTPLDEFPVKGRATSGVQVNASGVDAAAAGILRTDSDLLVRTSSGQTVRLNAREIPKYSRASRGAVLLKLDGDDHVTGLTIYPPEA